VFAIEDKRFSKLQNKNRFTFITAV